MQPNGIDFVVPATYPTDVSWSDPIETGPVWSLLDRSVSRYADRPCLDFLDRRFTYAEVGRLVERTARGLQDMGLKRGDRVGLFLPNTPYSVVFLFAILKAGGTCVNFNPLYVEHEIKHQIEDSGTEIMVTLDHVATYPKLARMLGQTRLRKIIVCAMADILPFPKNLLYPLVKRADIARFPRDERHVSFRTLATNDGGPRPVEVDPLKDVAVLQYTGGTTGTPKGAMLTHANIVANAEQCLRWFPGARLGHERVMAVLPFFHVFALTVAETLAIAGGCEIILLPRFDLDQLLQTIDKKKPTMFPGVPTLYTAINHHKDIAKYDLSSIRYCLSGGAPLPLEVKTGFERLTGATVCEGYGLSETSPVVTSNPLTGVNKAGSIGLPMPRTIIEIVSLDDPDKRMPQGDRGEVVVRGPQVMASYWNNPEETAKVLKDGRLRTGDVGYIDEDGYIFLVDRIKDLIIAGGYNVYPRNVEEAIYHHPNVAECVVIGVSDPYRGQTVKAFVVRRPDCELDEATLKAFLKDKLSPIEMPKMIEFRDSLPKTQVGKLSKKALQDEEAARAAPAA